MFRFTIRDMLWLIVVVGILCAWWLSPRQPFRFLRGKNPVLVNDRNDSTCQSIARFYAFKEDFVEANRRIAKELTAHGFILAADDYTFGPRAIQYERHANSGSLGDYVIVFKDRHYKLPQHGEQHSVIGYEDAGWVSVQVYIERRPSVFDTLLSNARDWL